MPYFVYDINKGVEMYLVLLELVSTGIIMLKFVCAINKDVGMYLFLLELLSIAKRGWINCKMCRGGSIDDKL